MKKLLMVLVVTVIAGCSNGLDDEIFKADINNHFKKLKTDKNIEEVLDVVILGKKEEGDSLIVKTNVMTQSVSNGKKAAMNNWEVTLTYTKCEYQWKVNVNHSKLDQTQK